MTSDSNKKVRKTVWIINPYSSTPETGMGGRHFYLAQELARMGHQVFVIASSTHHLLSKPIYTKQSIKIEHITPHFNFIWVKGINYPQAHSKKRILNWFLFTWRLRLLAKKIATKPDAILCSSPSPFAFLGAERLAKKFDAKLLFEVRDIWPLTLIEVGGHSKNHPFIKLIQWVEDRAYRNADGVISNLKNSVEHMMQRGMEKRKFTWIPNGFSLSEAEQKAPLPPETLAQIPNNKFIVGYTGTLGLANSMDTLIDAAAILKKYTDISFVLVGHGKEKTVLQEKVKFKALNNVTFIDAIPKNQIQSMLIEFDACFIGWRKENLYHFGIGANKIPEYLFSGKPIIHAFSGVCDPIEEYKAGLICEAENPEALAQTILHMQQISAKKRQTMGANGRAAALAHYEYSQLAKKLVTLLFTDKNKI